MATCKDCIHYDVCRQFRPREHIETLDKLQYVEAVCRGLFKDKNKLAPVVHGRWDLKIEGYGPDVCGEYWEESFLVCSECGRREEVDIDVAFSDERFNAAIERFPYCHCGAKMDKE